MPEAPTWRGVWGNLPPENFYILKLGNATFIINFNFLYFLLELGVVCLLYLALLAPPCLSYGTKDRSLLISKSGFSLISLKAFFVAGVIFLLRVNLDGKNNETHINSTCSTMLPCNWF